MNANEQDTETLIALVSSLLNTVVDNGTILEAILLADGDVQRAAESLNTSNKKDATNSTPGRSKGKKRKTSNLDAWLNKTHSKTSGSRERPQEGNAKSPSPELKHRLSSEAKPLVDLMTILRPPPSDDASKRKVKGLPPLTLANPTMVSDHTPCTLHLSVLPPELACQLFYTMLERAKNWKRNKWWLFDRVVESPHRTSFFARFTDNESGNQQDATDWQEAARFWYNGRMTDPPEVFSPEMEAACEIVERIVNEELKKRKRYRLEYGGVSPGRPNANNTVWKANVAASNCYEGAKESVGFHSDQLTYLGPYPTIASLSLGTTRMFRLREVIPVGEVETRKARTFNIPLPHNSLTIMHASCQEKFKHSIPPQSTIDIFRPPSSATAISTSTSTSYYPSNCRINITFRFYRPDFRPRTIPKCDCGVPTILRPDMKNRTDGETDRYWWTCYAGAQNEGKGCKYWKILDMKKEGRGPCVGDLDIGESRSKDKGEC